MGEPHPDSDDDWLEELLDMKKPCAQNVSRLTYWTTPQLMDHMPLQFWHLFEYKDLVLEVFNGCSWLSWYRSIWFSMLIRLSFHAASKPSPLFFCCMCMCMCPCAAEDSRAHHEIHPGLSNSSKRVRTCAPWVDHMPSDVVVLPRLDECLNSIQNDSIFYHCLPPRNATAGAALSHCVSRVAAILKREYPCVFKFGFSHCLKWRWYNQKYGYCKDRDKYQHMVAIFISGAAIGASLMEAILIKEHFGSSMDGLAILILHIYFVWCCVGNVWRMYQLLIPNMSVNMSVHNG